MTTSSDTDGAAALATAIREGRTTAVAEMRRLLDEIMRRDPQIGAFVAVDAEGALRRAAALDAERAVGRLRGPLHGVPIAYKDLCFIAGLPNTCGTAVVDYWTADRDCTVARRLTAAGAITLGKVRMTELAMGTFGVNEIQGTPRNPRAPERVPGGSSSGSAVAVAAGFVPAAIGTDTGGSIRLPAACCGVVGLKPTYGRVSLAGLMPLSPSLDHVGPIARTVRDVALFLAAMGGHDPADPSSVDAPMSDVVASLEASVAGLTVAVADNDDFRDVDPGVRDALEEVAAVLARHQVLVKRLRVPDLQPMMDATATIVRAESAAAHRTRVARLPRVQALVRKRLDAGAAVSAVDYLDARRAMAKLRDEFVREVFSVADAVLLPMLPGPPPTLSDASSGTADEIAERMARFARFARFVNGLGVPALAAPCATPYATPPHSFQLVAAPFREDVVLRLGAAVAV